jgi:hypothetical protein
LLVILILSLVEGKNLRTSTLLLLSFLRALRLEWGTMKISLYLFAAAALLTTSLHALTPEEQAVLAPVKAMFDGMAKRDAAAIKEPLLPGGSMVLMRDGKPSQMTFDAFAERVGRPGTTQIEERIHDPLIRIDNDLAMVWAPFDFLVDGKVDHCGTDLFNLVRKDGKWLIASVADTGRKDCAAK